MAHVAFANPDIERFHLHERLRRELLQRGHRVTVLGVDRARRTFWQSQCDGVVDLAARSPRRTVDTLRRWFDRAAPDLVLLHRGRGPAEAAIADEATQRGAATLWTGDGLLPHTMQCDDRGLDGDAGCLRFAPRDFRVVTPDRQLLDASLSHAFAAAEPQPLSRADVREPPAGRRLLDAARELLAGRTGRVSTALHGWRRAVRDGGAAPTEVPIARDGRELPQPFVAVLLQHREDPKLHLDAQPVAAESLLRAARTAADALDGGSVVAVAPDERPDLVTAQLPHELAAGIRVVPRRVGAVATATATVVLTVNHPGATVALLADTPVAHTGRALFALPGVTVRASPDGLAEAALQAIRRPRRALCRRWLSWLLRHGHVWCSPTEPHFQGMLGLVAAVERRLQGHASRASLGPHYRAGPPWPLALAPRPDEPR